MKVTVLYDAGGWKSVSLAHSSAWRKSDSPTTSSNFAKLGGGRCSARQCLYPLGWCRIMLEIIDVGIERVQDELQRRGCPRQKDGRDDREDPSVASIVQRSPDSGGAEKPIGAQVLRVACGTLINVKAPVTASTRGQETGWVFVIGSRKINCQLTDCKPHTVKKLKPRCVRRRALRPNRWGIFPGVRDRADRLLDIMQIMRVLSPANSGMLRSTTIKGIFEASLDAKEERISAK